MIKFMKILRAVGIILVLFGLGTLSFLFPVLLIPLALLILWIIVAVVMSKRKKKFKAEKEIPQEILEDFEYAEQKYISSGYKASPTEILWEIAKRKQPQFATSIPVQTQVYQSLPKEEIIIKHKKKNFLKRRR